MSFENVELETIYMPLLNQGTEVARPVTAVRVGELTYVVTLTADYDPTVEDWEFAPGTIVKCHKEIRTGRSDEKNELLVAREKYIP